MEITQSHRGMTVNDFPCSYLSQFIESIKLQDKTQVNAMSYLPSV